MKDGFTKQLKSRPIGAAFSLFGNPELFSSQP